MHARKRPFQGALLGLCLLLAACGSAELYTKLTEPQVNEMIAVLQSSGIEAGKESSGETGWTLTTAKGDFGRAVEVLRAQGYPREEFASQCSVFKKEGFVSSQTEEQARLNCAKSQELAQSISSIDGVLQARVHLALPEVKPMSNEVQLASASVFVKYRPGSNIDAQIGKIKALVTNSIKGMKYENVSVATFAAQPLPVAQVSPSSSIGGIVTALLVAAALAIAGMFGYPLFRRWQQRRRAAARRATVVVSGPRDGEV